MLTHVRRVACAVTLLAGVMVTPGAAQPFDRRTMFTFSGPVSIPGVTLPAGQYVFRLADPTMSHRVVQVLSADGTTPYAMFFTYPADRVEASTQPEVRLMETATGMPVAIQTWWYPGERTGYEFIYPKEQARKLAQGAADPVLTTQAQTTTTAQTNTADLARLSSSGQEMPVTADVVPTAPTSGLTQEGSIGSATLTIPNAMLPPVASLNRLFAPPQRIAWTGPTAQAVTRSPLLATASPLPSIEACGIAAPGGGELPRSPRGPREMR
jgi:hypothetical protein